MDPLHTKWERLIDSSVTRVISVLNFKSPNATNRWRDTWDDFMSLLQVLTIASDRPGFRWNKLVQSGVIDTLCKNVLRPDFLPSLARFAFHGMLNILFNCCTHLADPLSSTEEIIALVKRHWRALVKHSWDMSFLIRDDVEDERKMIAITFLEVVGHDASILDIVDEESDFTVPVFIRNIRYSTSYADIFQNAEAMLHIFSPITAVYDLGTPHSVLRYRKIHPAPSHLHGMIGTGTFGSYKPLFLSLGAQLPVLPKDRIMTCILFVYTLQKTVDIKTEDGLNFTRELDCCIPLWRALWKVMQSGESENSNAETTYILKLAFRTIAFSTTQDWGLIEEERSKLVRTWIRSGFIGALEHVLVRWPAQSGIALNLAPPFLEFYRVIQHNPSPFLPLLRRETPRPRILRALLHWANLDQSKDFPDLPEPLAVWQVDAGRMMWRMWYFIEAASSLRHQCMRRGCTRKGRARCKGCKSTLYCDVECQASDWHDHRFICGFCDDDLSSAAVLHHLPPVETFIEFIGQNSVERVLDWIGIEDTARRADFMEGAASNPWDGAVPNVRRLPFRFERMEELPSSTEPFIGVRLPD